MKKIKMTIKRKIDSDLSGNEDNKRRKKVMTLHEKINLLDKMSNGRKSLASLGREFGINESTVRSIKNSEGKIRSSVATSSSKNAKTVSISRDSRIEKLEKALTIWIEDQSQHKVALSGQIIREKALRLYEHLSQTDSPEENSEKTFLASKDGLKTSKNEQLSTMSKPQGSQHLLIIQQQKIFLPN